MSVSANRVNRLPIVVAVLAVTLLLGVGITQCSKPKIVTTAEAPAPPVATPAVPARPSDADGTEATIRTLSAKLGTVVEVQEAQKNQSAKLDALAESIAADKAANPTSEVVASLQQLQAQNTALMERLLALESKAAIPTDAGGDFGLPAGALPGGLNGVDLNGAALGSPLGSTGTLATAPNGGYQWVRPLDRPLQVDANGVPIPEAAQFSAGEITPVAPSAIAEVLVPTVKPRFTLPVNATLLDNTAMTAFIGRVPVDGTVQDPYRFKILASSEGLATNGFRLPPEVKGMVFSGTSQGDWNLSCVRGAIDSVTFTYEDGSVQTYGGEVAVADGTGQTTTQRRSLGYLSDAAGVPCIKGERVSNAPKVLAARFAASAFEATARGFAEAATTSQATTSGSVVRTIDDAAQFGVANGLAGGASESRAWLESRLGQIFDAVYTAPGQKVAIHIEAQINLDQRSDARKLAYGNHGAKARTLD